MAGWFILLYLLVIAGFFGVAIYEHQTVTSLYLPVSSTLTILTTLLPVLSLFNTIYYHQSNPPSSQSPQTPLGLPAPGASSSSSSSLTNTYKPTAPTKRITLPATLQLAQLGVTIFLLSTFLSTSTIGDSDSSSSSSPGITDCLLSTKWKSLWTTHNGAAIKQIQDQLSCCGFRSVKDMSYPFPGGSPDDGEKHVDCVALYGRHVPCLAGWEGELKGLIGGEVGVLVFTGLVQFLGWYFADKTWKNGNGSTGNTGGGGIGNLFRGLWRSVVVGMGERRDGRGREWGDEEDTTNNAGRRGANGGRGGRGGGRGSRLLVGGGEVGRLVEVDDDDDESTGERDMGRDIERGHDRYGTAGAGAGGNVWRSG